MRKLTLLMILVATAAVGLPQEMKMPAPKTSGPQSDAQKAFEILKTMAGSLLAACSSESEPHPSECKQHPRWGL